MGKVIFQNLRVAVIAVHRDIHNDGIVKVAWRSVGLLRNINFLIVLLIVGIWLFCIVGTTGGTVKFVYNKIKSELTGTQIQQHSPALQPVPLSPQPTPVIPAQKQTPVAPGPTPAPVKPPEIPQEFHKY